MSKRVEERQFGLWESPISATSLGQGITFSDLAWDQDGTLVWREARGDRGVLVVQGPGGQAPRDLNQDYSARARVGYGGGDFAIGHGHAYFAEAASGRLYRQHLEHGRPEAITPAFGQYASPALSPDGRWLLFVHSYEDSDSLGIASVSGEGWPARLVSGEDFYMQPTWHPAGDRIAWIAWNHPNMPWDGTWLRMGVIARVRGGIPQLGALQTIAGNESTSIFQPRFSPDGRFLAYISDATGWWQIYLFDLESGEHRQLTYEPAEHGAPAWIQGVRTYDFSPDGRSLFFMRNQRGFNSLWRFDLEVVESSALPLPESYTSLDQVAVSPRVGTGDHLTIALIASGGQTPYRVITVEAAQERDAGSPQLVSPAGSGTGETVQKAGSRIPISTHVWRRSMAEDVPPQMYSPPEFLSWPGPDGGEVFGILFPSHNPAFAGLGDPPLIVLIHGGPTSQVRAWFNPRAQFFATRGYAVLEVNHRGSTGYGRDYRQALRGNWGIFDVQDAIAGARHLIKAGQVDGARLVIMGGSAGGFTVLQSLVEYPGFYKAGVCLYGVANQFTLVAETHKFEARYSDTLLGPLPQAAGLYRARSPIFHVDKIADPLIVFQGEDDQVVPRAQSDEIVDSLQRRGIPHEYHLYPGEGHGFRKPETIEHFYTATEKFLRQYVIYA